MSDRLALLVARLAQVRVQVDEAGQGDEAVGVDDRRAGGVEAAADLGDRARPRASRSARLPSAGSRRVIRRASLMRAPAIASLRPPDSSR